MTTVVHRRVLAGAATALFASSVYPVYNPRCTDGAMRLDDDDPIVHATREIAFQTGVTHPENVHVYVSMDGETGGSMGANVFGRGSVCISNAVYRGFHLDESVDDEDEDDLPSKEEAEFILAHECVHLAKNHSLVMSSFVPMAMLSSASITTKVSNKFLATLLGVGSLVVGGIYLSWWMEYEADHGAASLGHRFHIGGLSTLERTRRRNCMFKQMHPTRWITDEGNYLADTAHPWLTTRIDHLSSHNIDDCHNCAFCSLVSTPFRST
ncbi:hypothetical protein DYB37_011477 [Aphanomyces astaci]|uniref:Peptidase M48 domain-containing protein n=1 Tax=Aphanomyces astaci TaxID=112090 RepID=A0A3L6UZ57_APHAT|nr:hypothetical protein DYB35_003354 [Aphanomyces astaci]RHZ29538.1 hypothetical protein DYB37_011477 [Aphanomyces astaci]RLO01693.1 hypothetical protein DYB28_011398 [Aphanomyces astaci]